LFPTEIDVSVSRSELGKYWAEIITFPNCFTEADSFSGLIEMINDAVRTYFEIPKKYLSFMPNYISPIVQN
jgi:predicted RNase H-like HicB family nuclease